jgi:hypothetical protein
MAGKIPAKDSQVATSADPQEGVQLWGTVF